MTKIRHANRLCLLVFFIGCIKPIHIDRNMGDVRGVLTDRDLNPVKNAQVYVYRWLHGDEPVEKTISQERDNEDSDNSKDYGDYRGPADFKSAKTGADGNYKITLPPGTYCLVARKRHNQQIIEGPLNPEDFSSIVSEPVTIAGGETVRVKLKLINTLRDAGFFDRYLIRTYKTGISGRVLYSDGKAVSGVIVTANKDASKVGKRPDFISDTTDSEGNYTLYVYNRGVYHPGIKRQALGPYLSFHQKGDPENKTVSVSQGKIETGVDLVLEGDIPEPLL